MVDSTIYPEEDNNYGFYSLYEDVYSDAQTTYGGTSSSQQSVVGQSADWQGKYSVCRQTITFDLSGEGGVLESVSLYIYRDGYTEGTQQDYDIHVYGYTQSSVTEDDAGFTAYGDTLFASVNRYDCAYEVAEKLELNSSGVSYVEDKLGGDCIFMLRSSRDVNSNPPSYQVYEDVYFYTAESASYRPYLELTYGTVTWTPKIIMMCPILLASSLQYILSPLQSTMYKGVI